MTVIPDFVPAPSVRLLLGPCLPGSARHVPRGRHQLMTRMPLRDQVATYTLYQFDRMRSGMLVGLDDRPREQLLIQVCRAAADHNTLLFHLEANPGSAPAGLDVDRRVQLDDDTAVAELAAFLEQVIADRTAAGQPTGLTDFRPTLGQPGILLVIDDPPTAIRRIGAGRLLRILTRGARVGVAVLLVWPLVGLRVFEGHEELRAAVLGAGNCVATGDAPQAAWHDLARLYYLDTITPVRDRGYVLRQGEHAEFPLTGIASAPEAAELVAPVDPASVAGPTPTDPHNHITVTTSTNPTHPTSPTRPTRKEHDA